MATLKTQLENQVAKEMEIGCVPTSLSYSSGSLMAAICFFPTQNRGLSRISPSVLIVFPLPFPSPVVSGIDFKTVFFESS